MVNVHRDLVKLLKRTTFDFLSLPVVGYYSTQDHSEGRIYYQSQVPMHMDFKIPLQNNVLDGDMELSTYIPAGLYEKRVFTFENNVLKSMTHDTYEPQYSKGKTTHNSYVYKKGKFECVFDTHAYDYGNDFGHKEYPLKVSSRDMYDY